MTAPQPAFEPDYPTPGALSYRDGFVQGALERDLTAIPPHVLSWAIDRAIAAQATSQRAGRLFADCYYNLLTRPDFRDKQRREGILNREAYLLAVFEDELKRNTNKLL